MSPPPHPHRHSVQPQLYSSLWGPGCRDEGHPGGPEHEGTDPERASPPAAAAAGTPESGGQTVGSQQHEPQQRQQGQDKQQVTCGDMTRR